jgi:hypothetical protein
MLCAEQKVLEVIITKNKQGRIFFQMLQYSLGHSFLFLSLGAEFMFVGKNFWAVYDYGKKSWGKVLVFGGKSWGRLFAVRK